MTGALIEACGLTIRHGGAAVLEHVITSAHAVASAIDMTSRPASSALALDDDPSRRPMRTSTPDSLRFSAWACPCEP